MTKTIKPKSKAKHTTRPELIKAAERRVFVLTLRKNGANYRTIAATTIKRFGADHLPKNYDKRQAWRDVKAGLDEYRAQIAETAEELVTLELLRLDEMYLTIHAKAVKGSLTAVDRAIRLMERRARLVGLDAPKRQEIGVDDGTTISVTLTGGDDE